MTTPLILEAATAMLVALEALGSNFVVQEPRTIAACAPSPALRAAVRSGAQAPYAPRSARIAHSLCGVYRRRDVDVNAHSRRSRVLARLGLVHVRGRLVCLHSMSLPYAPSSRWSGRRTSSQNGPKI